MIVIMTYGGFCPRGAYVLPCHVTTRRPVQDHRQRTNSFTLALPELSLCPTAYPLRLIPGDNYLVMNSLPQEIIDEIIDDLPHSSLRSSSLVARRWRKRSQQRAFYMVSFVSESVVNKWHVDTQGDPGGISSYVQRARFYYIAEWKNPALFSRLLENFNSLTTLSIFGTQIPEEVPEHILHRGIGNRITALHLQESPQPSFVVPMILAFPNLKNLSVDYLMTVPSGPPLSHPVLPQRRTLDSLQVLGCTRSRVAETLANLHFVSRRLFLDVQTENIHGLLVLSSATIVELVLRGVSSLGVGHKRIT